MSPITIRKAVPSDLPVLLKFEQGVISAERPFDCTIKQDPVQYYNLEMMLTAPHIYLVVAEMDGEPIGSGYARIEDARPYLQHRQHGYLGFMYTVPGHRGKGVNRMIMNKLKEWSFNCGITELRLDVYHANVQAIRAYEKAGFVQHLVAMRMSIE